MRNSLSKGIDQYVYRAKLKGGKSAKYYRAVASYTNSENTKSKVSSLAKENVNAI